MLSNCPVLNVSGMGCNVVDWLTRIPAQGLDHVIIVAATQKGLLFRQYAIRLKKSGTPVSTSLHTVQPAVPRV